jgi:hypothetical protein
MILPGGPLRVFIATRPVDFTKRHRWPRRGGAADPAAGSALGRGLRLPGQTRGPGEAAGRGWEVARAGCGVPAAPHLPDLQAPRGRQVQLATDRGRGDAAVVGSARRLVRGPGGEADAHPSRGPAAGGAIATIQPLRQTESPFSSTGYRASGACSTAAMSLPPNAAGSEPLPDDVAALKALLLAERATTTRLTGQSEQLRALIKELQRALFGRRSEKPDQLEFALEDLEQALAEAAGQDEKTDATRQASRRQQRPCQSRRAAPAPAAGRGRDRAREHDLPVLPGRDASDRRGCRRAARPAGCGVPAAPHRVVPAQFKVIVTRRQKVGLPGLVRAQARRHRRRRA